MKTSLFRCLLGLIVISFCLPLAASTVSITAQPTNQTVLVGDTAIFNVTADGPPILKYQWYFNGTSLAKATNASLALTNVQTNKAGNYTVQVKDGIGSTVLSSNAVLTVLFPQLPTILAQPTNQTVWQGSNVIFSLTIGGFPPPAYQWWFNGTNISGANNASLILTNIQIAQAGNYAVLMTNVAGSILSSNATLTVVKSGPLQVCDEADLQVAVAAGGTITFGCDGVITLTKTLMIIKPTTLDGTGHAVTISGGNAVQLFSVNSGVSAAFINLTLANGLSAGSNGVAGPPVTDGQPGMGGAILNNGGTVALTGCLIVSNNATGGAGSAAQFPNTGAAGGAGWGGAICNLAGNLAVTNCDFAANGATGGAGGYGQNGGGNGGDACGGAIYSLGGNVVFQHSTFVLHTAQGGNPSHDLGAISASAGNALGGVVWSSNAIVNINNSTFTSNSVIGAGANGIFGAGGWGSGGVIYAQSGVVNCIGCIFATNTAAGGFAAKSYSPGSALGGAICSYASLSVSQSSFWGNQASGNSGGFAVGEGNGGAIFNGNSLSLSGNTFANNAVVGGNGVNVSGLGNTPGGMGQGGAVCSQGTLTATNCTLTANSAKGGIPVNGITSAPGSGGDGRGGGLFNSGTATLVNLTLATNNAIGGAGGRDITGAYPLDPMAFPLVAPYAIQMERSMSTTPFCPIAVPAAIPGERCPIWVTTSVRMAVRDFLRPVV